ncbi:MAG: hypothetical protein EA397_15030 [Deltaproteobacteria bacterium]|nr:MAG: hypothetical protein EA397_15030 [Deltaproteobacteria bacterium]
MHRRVVRFPIGELGRTRGSGWDRATDVAPLSLPPPLFWITSLGVAVGLVRLALAAQLGLLADEAYYLMWSRDLAWGYYDQPPLIAALLAWLPIEDPSRLLARAPALVCGLLGMLAMAWVSEDRLVAIGWWLGVPALFGLTLFSTPDAPLLAAWAGVMAAASIGGRGWLLAGALGAVAVLSKHTGLLALPLALLALGPKEWRTPWPWLGLALAVLLLLPHLGWLLYHDGVTVRFQLAEGFVARRPGWLGPVRFVADQLLVLGPLTALGVVWGLRRGTWTRPARIGAGTAVGVLALFLVASPFGEPEAHWPAPAWVGLGFLVACRPAGRLLWAGLGLGLVGALALGLVAAGPLDHFSPELRARFTEAEELRRALSELSEGPLLCERYQDAALAHVLTGREVFRPQGVGRDDQLQRFGPAPPRQGWCLRPRAPVGEPCLEAPYLPRGSVQDLGRWQAVWVEVP